MKRSMVFHRGLLETKMEEIPEVTKKLAPFAKKQSRRSIIMESAMEFTFLKELLKDDSDVQTELELSGLDPDELEFMDAVERREALEDAGLDSDEYDF